MARLIEYRNQQLTAKQINQKYNIPLGTIYPQLTYGAKVRDHYMSWANQQKKEDSPILQKKRLISSLKELEAEYQECISASKIIIKSLEDEIYIFEKMN